MSFNTEIFSDKVFILSVRLFLNSTDSLESDVMLWRVAFPSIIIRLGIKTLEDLII